MAIYSTTEALALIRDARPKNTINDAIVFSPFKLGNEVPTAFYPGDELYIAPGAKKIILQIAASRCFNRNANPDPISDEWLGSDFFVYFISVFNITPYYTNEANEAVAFSNIYDTLFQLPTQYLNIANSFTAQNKFEIKIEAPQGRNLPDMYMNYDALQSKIFSNFTEENIPCDVIVYY